MARNRDWVDYANVAANVVQTAQLDGVNSKMRQLSELGLRKEYREQQEAAVAKCEDILRDAVFFYTEQLRDLEEIASQNPVAAYIRASHLKRTYAKMPKFKASGFRKFEDKERLARVQRNFDRLISASAQNLQAGEQEACDRCIAHIFERKKLVKSISVQEQAEQLERDRGSLTERQAAMQAELQKIREQKSKRSFWVKIGNAVSGLCPEDKAAAALEGEIAAMNQDIARREGEINRHKSLFTRFGTAKSDDYRRMLEERDTLLTQMLGDFAKGFIKRAPTPVETPVLGAEDQKINDAVLALMALGFKEVQAHDAVRRVLSMLGPKASVEDLVRACLKKES